MAEDVIKLFIFRWDSTGVYIHARTVDEAVELLKNGRNGKAPISEENGVLFYEWDANFKEPIEMSVSEIKSGIITIIAH